jgi:hypothetical protein
MNNNRRRERRSSPRAKTRLFCWCSSDQFRASGTILNVSEDGAFVRLPISFAPGEAVTIDVIDESGKEVHRVSGTVVWCSREDPIGCGVVFLKPSPDLVELALKPEAE